MDQKIEKLKEDSDKNNLTHLRKTQPETMKKCDFILTQVKKISKLDTEEKFFKAVNFDESNLYELNKKSTDVKL